LVAQPFIQRESLRATLPAARRSSGQQSTLDEALAHLKDQPSWFLGDNHYGKKAAGSG
jgi:hypothetical protein